MTRRSIALAVAGAALMAAPAHAADRAAELSAQSPESRWTTPEKSGFVYFGDVAEQVPACSPILFECDSTLVHVKEDAAKLTFSITGIPSDTFKDVDLHIFKSDASGAKGTLLGDSTSPGLDEAVALSTSRSKAGYYLVYLDWYFGRGAVDAKATFTPKPVMPTATKRARAKRR